MEGQLCAALLQEAVGLLPVRVENGFMLHTGAALEAGPAATRVG
jgi:hypothetical protein